MKEENNFWDIITPYFQNNNYFITRHHLDSFNYFVDAMIPRVIETMNKQLTVYKYDNDGREKHRIEMHIGKEDGSGIYFDHPTIHYDGKTRLMLPNDARLHDLTYATNLLCDIEIVHYNKGIRGETTLLERVKLGRIPIMLHSKLCFLRGKTPPLLKELGECPYDQGGYFIVDGKEKVVITQERNITNQIFVHPSRDEKFSFDSFIRCTSEKDSVFPKKVNFKVFSQHFMRGSRKDAIIVEVPHLDTEIPLFVLFRCLGIESDLAILQCIIGKDLDTEEGRLFFDFLYPSIVDGNFIYNKRQALYYLKHFTTFKEHDSEKVVEYVLQNNLFPNIEYDISKLSGKNENNTDVIQYAKAMFLGHIIHKLVRVCIGMEPTTDRDNYMFRRVAISGFLIGDIFKDFYNAFRNNARNSLDALYERGNWITRDVISRSVTEANKHDIFDSQIITAGLNNSFKGSWGINKEKMGIVQDLNRISYISAVSHLRLVSSPMDPSIKIRSPHQLNTSQYGIMCPCESPDGQSIGLIKNFAIMCHVTFPTRSDQVVKAITKYFNITYLEHLIRGTSLSPRMVKIMINNTWIGVVDEDEAHELVTFVRLLRRNALINVFVSISWNITTRTINILTEGGRCSRPLLIVDPESQELRINLPHHKKFRDAFHKQTKNWYILCKGSTLSEDDFDMYKDTFIDPEDVFSSGGSSRKKIMEKLEHNASFIEFLDVEEVNKSMIAMYPSDITHKDVHKYIPYYTHCELHPSLMLSAYTSTIPLAHHNQAPRNIFSAAQGKQAIGLYATNFRNRIDTMGYVLHYPQKRFVSSRFSDFLNMKDLPNGENLIVAISSHLGYNQEDSIIYNKDSVERGMFNITSYKSYTSHEDENEKTGESLTFGNPYQWQKEGKDVPIKKFANYTKIDEHGFPKVNTTIEEGDVVVGKIKKEKNDVKLSNIDILFDHENQDPYKYINKSEIADKTIGGKVDKVYVKQNFSTLKRDLKVRLRKFKLPELGDKAASTHGQKGVCGMVLPANSLPFTKEGVVPDIIINAHAIPSRMTVGHILECVLNKAAVLDGINIDATPFEPTNMEYFYDRLQDHGYNRFSDEIMYDGQTGQQMKTDIFLGPNYYHRLKHMVTDKINYRDTGKVLGVTMQPTKGRSNQGGLRIGEMEANALASHGMFSFLKESLMEKSDKYSFFVNEKDGRLLDIAQIPHRHNMYVDEKTNKIKGALPRVNTYHDHKFIKQIELPYAFKLLTQELNTMFLDVKFNVGDLYKLPVQEQSHEEILDTDNESAASASELDEEENVVVD